MKDQLNKAMLFAREYLGIPDDVEIEIHTGDMVSHLNGYVIDMSEDTFEIHLRDRALGDMMATLFHEMVHIRQHLFDDLSNQLDTLCEVPYSDRWWEIEANEVGYEIGLLYVNFLYARK